MTSFAFLSDSGFLKVGPPTAATPYAVAGIAWDGATTNRPGARFGPRAVRQASHMLCDGIHPHFDVSPIGQLGDAGDLALPNTSLDAHARGAGAAGQRARSAATTWPGSAATTRSPCRCCAPTARIWAGRWR